MDQIGDPQWEIEMQTIRSKQQCLKYYVPSELTQSLYETVKRIYREGQNKESKFRNQVEGILYINPLTIKLQLWNTLVIFTEYFFAYHISLMLGFGPQFWQNQLGKDPYIISYVLFLTILIVDIFINLNKGYYAIGYGKVVYDKTLIFKRYFKSYLFVDLLCIGLLMIPLFINDYQFNYIQILCIVLIVIKKFRSQSEIQRSLFQRSPKLRKIFILGMLTCDLFLVGNFGACMFLGIDLLLWRLNFFGNNPSYYWLSDNANYAQNLIDGPWLAQYAFAQQFSFGTLSSLASGPCGANPIQITYQIIVMLSYISFASYVVQTIRNILSNTQEIRVFHDNNIIKFTNFLKVKGIKMDIIYRIHNFFQLIWQFEVKDQNQNERDIITKLPINLQQQLLSQLSFAHQIYFIQYFKIGSDIRKVIGFNFKTNIIDPNTTIFEIGYNADPYAQKYIYYFRNGVTKYYFPINKSQNILSLSNVSKLVGQYEFITNLSYSFSGKSIDLCVIQKISFNDMKNILQNFNLKEQFQVLKTKVLFQHQFKFIKKNCIICNEKHIQSSCPLVMIHYNFLQQIDQIIMEVNCGQQRIKYSREVTKSVKKIQGTGYIPKKNKIQRIMPKTDQNFSIDSICNYQKYYSKYNMNEQNEN